MKNFLKKNESIDITNVNKGQKPLTNKGNLVVIAGCAIIIVILIIIGILTCKINTFEYISIEYTGFDGYGSASVSLDKKLLLSNIIGTEPSEKNWQKYMQWQKDFADYSSYISFSCDKSENLSNGDKVIVTVSAKNELASKIKSGSKTYTVSGLPKAEVVDVFKDLSVSFTGINGQGTLKIDNNSDNLFAQSCTFKADNDIGLSNGEKVTIAVSYDPENFVEPNYVPTTTSNTYTVSGLSEYISDTSNLDLSSIKKLESEFLKEVKGEKENDYMFSYSNFKVYKSWLLNLKEDIEFNNTYNNIVVCVSYDEYLYGDFRRTVYTFLEFRNISASNNETIALKYENGVNSSFVTDIESKLSDWKEEYIVKELS